MTEYLSDEDIAKKRMVVLGLENVAITLEQIGRFDLSVKVEQLNLLVKEIFANDYAESMCRQR